MIDSLPMLQRQHGADWVKAFVDYYLSKSHRSDMECGCAMASLTPEVVRFGAEIHTVFEKKMLVIAGLIADGLAGKTKEIRLSRAWAMLGVLIGGINIVRGMQTTEAAEAVANAIKFAAIKASGPIRAVK